MRDRFINGFISGIIAFLITTPISFILTHYKVVSYNFSDFAAMITLHRFPETLGEILFGAAAEAMISAAWGIVFAYLVLFIGYKHLLFKGFVYAALFWYIYANVILFLNKVILNLETAILSGFLAGLWGIIMAKSFDWLQKDQH